MTHKSANSNSTNEPEHPTRMRVLPALSAVEGSEDPESKGAARCQHRTSTGRRCRLRVVDAHSGLCFRHAQLHLQHLEVPDLSPDLVGTLTGFTSAADINRVLSKLLILLSQNRVSPRRAAVIAYISNLLLRTLPAIEHESDDDGTQIIFDVPRPDRSSFPEAGEPVGQTP